MSAFDLPLEQLHAYVPDRHEPDDFDAFWSDTLTSSRAAATEPTFTRFPTDLRTVTTFDVSFSGYQGQRIRGWLNVPSEAGGLLPTPA